MGAPHCFSACVHLSGEQGRLGHSSYGILAPQMLSGSASSWLAPLHLVLYTRTVNFQPQKRDKMDSAMCCWNIRLLIKKHQGQSVKASWLGITWGPSWEHSTLQISGRTGAKLSLDEWGWYNRHCPARAVARTKPRVLEHHPILTPWPWTRNRNEDSL